MTRNVGTHNQKRNYTSKINVGYVIGFMLHTIDVIGERQFYTIIQYLLKFS